MTYFSAFTGVGGFELALRDHACVGYSEIHRTALAVYRYHFPDHTPYGDITQLDARAVPTFDLLVAGFPCQAYSVAGHRRGFSDARGALFFDLARFIAAKRPRLLLLENVQGLLNHADGQTFAAILAALDELGYDCQWEVRHAREYTAQDRRRLFLIGHRRGTRRPQVFPLGARDPGLPPIAVTRSNGVWRSRSDVTTIDASYAKGIDNHGQRTALYVPTRRRRRHALLQKMSDSARSVAQTVTRSAGDGNLALAHAGRLRRLTPRECERLMTWPDDWTRYGVNEHGDRVELSDRARYTLCGNGVVSAVARPLLDILTHT
ncbi:MAG: (cytosine-5)-methyltransferase 1 [Thermoanaerobaculia bacterium]|jgi:DNA (cytosine-5)-methyltransferase 1|nr:(cytosine-5)-methyltransferase 1 [Thermoanaerobaculia bacterium]